MFAQILTIANQELIYSPRSSHVFLNHMDFNFPAMTFKSSYDTVST